MDRRRCRWTVEVLSFSGTVVGRLRGQRERRAGVVDVWEAPAGEGVVGIWDLVTAAAT